MTAAESWIDLLLKRSADLRRAGILSIGCDGNSAVLAPADPELDDSKDDASTAVDEEPANAWDNPASYPSGVVPSLRIDKDELPDIPEFDS